MRSCSANDTIIHQLRHRNTTTHYYLILFCILLLEYCCNQCSSSSLITLTNTINTTNVPATSNQVSKTTTTPTTTTTTTTTAIVERPIIDCEQAYVKCDLRKVCAPALRSYNQDCNDLITNQTNGCSQKCLKAMIALKSSDEGDDLVRCDCQQSQYCQQSKERSLLCKPQVDKAIEPNVRVSCSVASWICLADQMCSTALDYYYRNCQSMFTDKHCSNKCNNSLSILYRQEKAAKLIDCVCDGSEEFSCMKYKTYTQKLCLNNKIDDDLLSPQQQRQQQQNEDDDSVEDNWIPVMNGGATSGFNYGPIIVGNRKHHLGLRNRNNNKHTESVVDNSDSNLDDYIDSSSSPLHNHHHQHQPEIISNSFDSDLVNDFITNGASAYEQSNESSNNNDDDYETQQRSHSAIGYHQRPLLVFDAKEIEHQLMVRRRQQKTEREFARRKDLLEQNQHLAGQQSIIQQRSSNKLTRSQNNINNRKSRANNANNNVFYRSLYGGSSSSSSIWSCNHLTSIFICWILLYIISAKHW